VENEIVNNASPNPPRTVVTGAMAKMKPEKNSRAALLASPAELGDFANARPRAPPEEHVEPVLTSIRGARIMTGLGNTTIWALIRARELQTVKFGRRTMVTVASIHAMIERRMAMKGA
jgi:hypothetical protein